MTTRALLDPPSRPGPGFLLRILALCVCAVAVAGPTAAGPVDAPTPRDTPGAKVIGDGIIVPGSRVGPLRLSMRIEDFTQVLGRNFKREEFEEEGVILYEWRQEGIWVSFNRQTRTLRVISAFGANPQYRTDKGISLLNPFTRAEGVYGKDYRKWEFKKERVTLIRYMALGLQFGVANDPRQPLVNGRIFQIGIFKPGDLPPVRLPD